MVEAFLHRYRDLRMATRADCRCDDAIAARRKSVDGYEPFVAAGDFNGDGKDDLAVLFYTSEPYVYAPGVLVIFNGPLSSGMAPAFSRGDVPLDRSGLFVSPAKPHRLGFGRLGFGGCSYQPFDRGYREDCSAGR